jgi:hypothetical protein
MMETTCLQFVRTIRRIAPHICPSIAHYSFSIYKFASISVLVAGINNSSYCLSAAVLVYLISIEAHNGLIAVAMRVNSCARTVYQGPSNEQGCRCRCWC